MLDDRIYTMKQADSAGECVIYVMSRDQRIQYNHALLAAQKHALAKDLPFCVVFCLYEKSGVRAREQYEFMIEGLREVERGLKALKIPFMMLIGDPFERLSALFYHTQPDAVFFDFSPLRGPLALHKKLAGLHDTSMYEVDAHNIVPAKIVSQKMEVGARTLRTKIHKIVAQYLHDPEVLIQHPHLWPGTVMSIDSLAQDIEKVLFRLPKNGTKNSFASGERAANRQLDSFVDQKLATYGIDRNDPTLDGQSNLSPYLHFGHISALQIALRLREVSLQHGNDLHVLQSSKMPQLTDQGAVVQYSIDALIEELIVRKELADNFCLYNLGYDQLDSAPRWARRSLDLHQNDPREFIYTRQQLESAKTHDEAWNSAQIQLLKTGKMHGYMRMYWAKKVLEWSANPKDAISTLIYLNDRYSIDGGDPNGYAGILWSVAGVHDRPWAERSVFGVVRYMNYEGLRRKFAVKEYQDQWL